MKTLVPLMLAGATLVLAGCASDPKQEHDPAFGSSVRQMIQAQIHDPKAAANPPAEAPDGVDGQRAEQVVQTYRKDADKPSAVRERLTIQVSD
jgi:type IV pilus biogenesis protein CpaD/CtpE